jgi:2-dehydropantoate 2-reductase
MVEPGVYHQSNAGHILLGEIDGGESERARAVSRELQRAIRTQVTPNMGGAIWSKLLLNCSVTTLGAVAGQTMRQYHATAAGKEVFRRMYDETLSVAIATGATPEKMMVDPIPPGWEGQSAPGAPYHAWITQILGAYGDLKASMLQDFERGRKTEADFINGYVAQVGTKVGLPTPLNSAAHEVIQRIEQGRARPDPARLQEILAAL